MGQGMHHCNQIGVYLTRARDGKAPLAAFCACSRSNLAIKYEWEGDGEKLKCLSLGRGCEAEGASLLSSRL